jgi:electron transport complex protein RnfG
MKSTLKNMVLMLFVIALVCSGAVAVVFQLTEEPIALAQQNKAVEALRNTLPEFDTIIDTVEMDGCVIYEVLKDEEFVGYAVKTLSPNGFNGDIELMVGFNADGIINNIEVLSQAETPGLGANMSSADNALLKSFVGKKASKMDMRVKKDGGEVDALTAATISSRAYAEAVGFAYEAVKKYESENTEQGGFNATCFVEGSSVVGNEVIDGNLVEIIGKDDQRIGCVIYTSAQGYSRAVPVSLAVFFDTNSTIVDVAVVEQQETPSLGGKMTEEGNVLLSSVKGKDASKLNFALRNSGGDIDAITSATISSRAYAKAVEEAYETYKKVNL